MHVGHLVAATWVRDALHLDRVLMVVANEPWQKTPSRHVTAAADRFAVVAAAVEGVEGIEASRVEIDRGGPSYTADTVAELEARLPDAALFLVVGADVAAQLSTWQRVDELKPLVTLVVVGRGGRSAPADLDGWSVERFEIPTLEISSSDLRARLAQGRPVDFLVPAPAIRCIVERGLYAGTR